MGQSLTIQTWPSRSTMVALISPTFSCIRSRQSFFPWMMASRASFTHAGQSESVCLGKPRVGLVFSQDFSSGLSDHCGVTDGFGLYLLKNWIVLKVTPAVLQTAQSIALRTCVPTRFGINLYPPLSESYLELGPWVLSPLNRWSRDSTIAPGLSFVCLETVPWTPGTSNKSLDTYSLRGAGEG